VLNVVGNLWEHCLDLAASVPVLHKTSNVAVASIATESRNSIVSTILLLWPGGCILKVKHLKTFESTGLLEYISDIKIRMGLHS